MDLPHEDNKKETGFSAFTSFAKEFAVLLNAAIAATTLCELVTRLLSRMGGFLRVPLFVFEPTFWAPDLFIAFRCASCTCAPPICCPW
jgi:hypothetical protein